MANEESTNNKFSSNLKVPPLKIVLTSQNNAVVNISSSIDDGQFKSSSNDKDDNSNDHLDEELNGGRRNGFEVGDNGDKHHSHKKSSKGSSDRHDSESGQASSRTAVYSSSSSSSSSCDRSASTTPSSESESLASNSTIISDQHQQAKSKSENKEDASSASTNKQDRISRYGVKVSSSERSSNSSTNLGKKSQDNTEQTSDTATPSSKEQHLNANQRITRSSQRAAQQSKTENPNEPNGDETTGPSENQEKIHESARKVKRRKGEVQEGEQDSAQTTAQLTVTMANIYPADYQLPSQNSFELYRDIRKRPYKKLMKLNHTQPRVPHGFKDYLLNAGPYLLDGNKLGMGLNGSKYESINNNGDQAKSNLDSSSRARLRMKLSNLHQRFSHYQPSQQRHSNYPIPKVAEVPKNLQNGSPLCELFQDQEKARQQMRMQHLKERERSILAAEQEILRAYNRAAIADIKQKLHLSACTYFYYQERYHYLDEKTGINGNSISKEVPHSQDNSFLCIEGGEAPAKTNDSNGLSSKDPESAKVTGESKPTKEEKNSRDSESLASSNSKELGQQNYKEINIDSSTVKMETTESLVTSEGETKSKDGQKESQTTTNGSKPDPKDSSTSDIVMTHTNIKSTDSNDTSRQAGEAERPESDKNQDQKKGANADSDNSVSESPNDKEGPTKSMSDEDLRVLNKEVFLNQLQDIDNKWDKIKRDMLVRHKNEADSLHAVQSLEWEWKAKEIGACDVRVSLKIEPEFVPRVEVLALDY